MYKSILVILLVGLLAAPAMAQPMYEPPDGGWGMDCEVWTHPIDCGNIYQEFALYDGTSPADCRGWAFFHLDDNGIWRPQPAFPMFGYLKLWVEKYAAMTCYNINWQFHFIMENGITAEFFICGQISSNDQLGVTIRDVTGVRRPFDLKFMHDVTGNANPTQQRMDFAPTYSFYMGEGVVIPDDKRPYQVNMPWYDGYLYFYVGPCDWWWCLYGYFCIDRHYYNGYWVLELEVDPMPII